MKHDDNFEQAVTRALREIMATRAPERFAIHDDLQRALDQWNAARRPLVVQPG